MQLTSIPRCYRVAQGVGQVTGEPAPPSFCPRTPRRQECSSADRRLLEQLGKPPRIRQLRDLRKPRPPLLHADLSPSRNPICRHRESGDTYFPDRQAPSNSPAARRSARAEPARKACKLPRRSGCLGPGSSSSAGEVLAEAQHPPGGNQRPVFTMCSASARSAHATPSGLITHLVDVVGDEQRPELAKVVPAWLLDAAGQGLAHQIPGRG